MPSPSNERYASPQAFSSKNVDALQRCIEALAARILKKFGNLFDWEQCDWIASSAAYRLLARLERDGASPERIAHELDRLATWESARYRGLTAKRSYLRRLGRNERCASSEASRDDLAAEAAIDVAELEQRIPDFVAAEWTLLYGEPGKTRLAETRRFNAALRAEGLTEEQYLVFRDEAQRLLSA